MTKVIQRQLLQCGLCSCRSCLQHRSFSRKETSVRHTKRPQISCANQIDIQIQSFQISTSLSFYSVKGLFYITNLLVASMWENKYTYVCGVGLRKEIWDIYLYVCITNKVGLAAWNVCREGETRMCKRRAGEESLRTHVLSCINVHALCFWK